MVGSLSFSLTLPSDLRMLSVARAFVEAVCQTQKLDNRTTHAVVLALGEAVTNIIRHAHCHHVEIPLQIRCKLTPQGLVLELQDEGAPFDLDAVPRLDPGELRIGGRGVYLMRALMDELSCQPRGPRGNVLRMVKHWPDLVRECG